MLNIKPSEAREYADEVAASIDEENRQLVEYKFQLSTAFEERLKPAKELKARYVLQQESILQLRKQNDDLARNPSEHEKSLLLRLEALREQRKHELNLLEEAKLELKEEKLRKKRLDDKLDEIEVQRQTELAKMRHLAKSYEDVLALYIEPSENGGLKITYKDLRRSFILKQSASGDDKIEIFGISGCENIVAEFNQRRNVGALLYRVREKLKARAP